MAYDEVLAGRVRWRLEGCSGYSEKKMFGGLCFLLNGNMCCGIVGDVFMARVGLAAHDDAMARPHTRAMEFTGRAMRGMVYVDPAGVATEGDLAEWVDRAARFAGSLPVKKGRGQ
jgi:hypothetical protein